MATIVFFCIPAWGHTNPTLGVVRELVGRGHRVVYYSYEPHRSAIEGVGAEFIPCDSYDAQLRLAPEDGARIARDLHFATKVLVDTTLALDEMVCRDMERLQPDCIVADSMAVWGKAVAAKLEIPFVSSTTTFAFNAHSSKIMKQNFGELLKMLWSLPRLNRQIRRLRARGYPMKHLLDILQNDNNTHTIVYTSPEFQPCSETFSDRYVFVGPSIRPVERPFVKGDRKLIYLAMGTVNNALLPLYRQCIAVLAPLGHRLVLSVGEQINLKELGELPANVEAFPRVDQIALLACADVFVTHCGMNSVSEALYFGVPLVLLPQTKEQEGVATRVEQLGAGIRPAGESCLAADVRRILEEPSYRLAASSIAQGFHRCSGPAGAAEHIVSVIDPSRR